MRRLLLVILGWSLAASGTPLDVFVAGARQRHGTAGEAAARFLVEHMPARDRENLSAEFLLENLDLAFQARSEFPWAAGVPESIFLNDVLPYAVFDEPRDPWRREFLEKSRDLVKEAKTAGEAAQILNRELFKKINVHYHTGRKRPNQSAKESMESGRATCTGLSIILVNACRAVGIPARAVGTPLWTNNRGNHTWIEIWDGDWHFTGADEYDAQGLNRGWFVGDAAKAKADVPRYAIYATSWRREGLTFPMVWARGSEVVAAVNVTARYAKAEVGTSPDPDRSGLGVRLFDRRGGLRVVARVSAVSETGRPLAESETRAGTADLNDLARLELKAGTRGWLRFRRGSELREGRFGPLAAGDPTLDLAWDELTAVSPRVHAIESWVAQPIAERTLNGPALQMALSREEAARVRDLLVADRLARLAAERQAEVEQMAITLDGRTLRWKSRTFGEAPPDGRSLWISMHGGGNAPTAVNDRQWENQSRLYEPAEGIYVAPRAPTDTWNLWHEAHIDPLFQRLIDNHVALLGVNPDKVYLLGYSAGGDGVWQLAPRMADRFAAAAMMAGHPNEASLLGLRNLPFAIFMGGDDAAYGRNKVAAERAAELDRLAREDPGGYPHFVRIYEGVGHWMQKRDSEALPWMAGFRRQAWPKRIVWVQDDVVHRRFYWLQIPAEETVTERPRMTATVDGQTILVTGEAPASLRLRLSDALVDLDQPLTVSVNGRSAFAGLVPRRASEILASLEERADPATVATAVVVVSAAP